MTAPRSLEASALLSSWALEMGACCALKLHVLGGDCSIVDISPGFERLTGYSPQEYFGKKVDFFQGPTTEACLLDELRSAIVANKPARVVLRSHRKNGTVFWNEVTVAPETGKQVEPTFVRVLLRDVTACMEAAGELELVSSQLADRQKLTSAILEGIHTAIITADRKGRVTYINRAARKVLGIGCSEPVDTTLGKLLSLPSDINSCLTEADHIRRLSYMLRRPDGQMVELGISVSRAFDDAHHDLGYFVVFRDLSDPMQFEVDVRRVERLAAMGTMVAGFAHEIRNPVSTLRILTETMLGDSRPGDPAIEYITRMMHQIVRIERLVTTSLQFGRPVAPRRASRSAAQIAAAALEAVAHKTQRAKGGSVRSEIAADLPQVYVDDAQITQVLVILLENAIDAAGAPRVTLRAQAISNSPEVRFEVADRGPGIPETLLQRVFDPFFTTKSNGTGLGLSIAQQLIHENGARIEVSSMEGHGTTFAVAVPRADAEGATARDKATYANLP